MWREINFMQNIKSDYVAGAATLYTFTSLRSSVLSIRIVIVSFARFALLTSECFSPDRRRRQQRQQRLRRRQWQKWRRRKLLKRPILIPRLTLTLPWWRTLSSLEHPHIIDHIMHIRRFYDVPNGNHQASKNFKTATIIISFFSLSTSLHLLLHLCSALCTDSTQHTVLCALYSVRYDLALGVRRCRQSRNF